MLVIGFASAFSVSAGRANDLRVLSDSDVRAYAQALVAAESGDFATMEGQLATVSDPSLVGQVERIRLMHPTAYHASYEDLIAWLKRYGDLAGADRVYALAAKRRPSTIGEPEKIGVPAAIAKLWHGTWQTAKNAVGRGAGPDRALAARDAYYSGDIERALELAPKAGEPWIAGLAAYRLGRYEDARRYFQRVEADASADPWVRSGAALWAARAAETTGDLSLVKPYLGLAARWPQTFYGMIAQRQLRRLQGDTTPSSLPELIQASYALPDPAAINRLLKASPRARRVVALSEVGRPDLAVLELRIGLTVAQTETTRQTWVELANQLGCDLAPEQAAVSPVQTVASPVPDDYPAPELFPQGGFTLDRALVYAIVRQESRFNPFAVSTAGAMGLMQVRPEAAARAAGDDQLLTNPIPLLDGPTNLRIGQDHLHWLMDRLFSRDLLQALAAYNAGPTPVLRTASQLGGAPDPLLLIESLPAKETRDYVERVMAAYWMYQRKFGASTPTLDALVASVSTPESGTLR